MATSILKRPRYGSSSCRISNRLLHVFRITLLEAIRKRIFGCFWSSCHPYIVTVIKVFVPKKFINYINLWQMIMVIEVECLDDLYILRECMKENLTKQNHEWARWWIQADEQSLKSIYNLLLLIAVWYFRLMWKSASLTCRLHSRTGKCLLR